MMISSVLGFRRAAIACALAACCASPASAAGKAWLDISPIVNWNHAGAAVPSAPASQNDASDYARCASVQRTAATPEDRAVTAKGWRLFGPYQLFGTTSILSGMAGVDGMCRPMEFQTFVFSNGTFAGTLSPNRMDARTDGQVEPLGLFSAKSISAPFARYSASDPLCCPSATTTVDFEVTATPNGPLVVPESSYTNKNVK